MDPIQTQAQVPDDDNAVSLPTGPTSDTSVSLPTPGVSQSPLPPEVAAQRAMKTKRGLGDILNKTEDEMYDEYLQGNETMLRKEAATQADFNNQMKIQKTLQDMAAQKGSPLDPSEVLKIVDPFNPANGQADPNDVIEKAYSKDFVGTLGTATSYMTGNIVNDARKEMPDQVDQTLDQGSELLTKNQYILSRMQNTEQNLVQQQSWPGYLADAAKTMFQPYVEYKERGLIPGSGILSGLGLGSNLDEQHQVLYRLPLDQFKEKFDTAMDYLEKNNPQEAVAYAKSLLSQNTMDATLGNAFSAMAIPDNIAALKGAGKLVSKIATFNKVRKATADIVSAAAKDPNAGAVRAAEGAGDVETAAVLKVAQENSDALQGRGDPIERAKDKLLSTWQDDAKKFVSNPGTYLSRELTTRIADQIVADGSDLFDRLGTMNRVERTPEFMTDPAYIASVKDRIKADYKGPPNTLLDIDGPIVEPTSNTKWFKSRIGNYDATLFSDQETATGFAKQLGIADPIISGSAPEKVYIPEAAAKGLQEVKTTPLGTRFYLEHGVEVVPSTTPEINHVPYNLKTGKFEPTLNAETAKVEQQGLGFYIEAWTPLKETDDMFRDLLIKTNTGAARPNAISTNSATGTAAIKNSLLGWFRNSDETMSVNETAQRKAVTYTQSNIQLWAHGLYKDLEDIAAGRVREDPVTGEPLSALRVYPKSWFGKITNREVAQQFERALDYARKVEDPETGKPGYFFKSPGELQDFYQRSFKRDPSYLETKAYFNYTKLIEGDRMMAEVSEFRNRARLGVEQHSVSAIDPETGDKVSSPFFDGVRLKEFPGGEDNILIMRQEKGNETLHKLGHIDTKSVDYYRDAVKTGKGRVIELYDFKHQPLDSYSDVARGKLVRYVYTEASEAKPLDFNHVERRGGGHFEWDYDHYIKQADVRPQYTQGINDKRPGVEYMYVGDTTVMPIKNRQMGHDIARLWNEAHGHINNNEWDKVKPIAQKLGIKYDEFTGWYKPGKDADGKPIAPRLNPKEPIVVVSKNKKINEMSGDLQARYPKGFRDMTKSGPANNFKVQYNQERNSSFDMRTINDVGTQGNPIYAHQPADMIDPLTTMNRALNRAINSTFMDDYKIYTAEHWLEEAKGYLDASEKELRSSPFFWLHNPKYRSGVDKTTVWNLESNRYKALQFIGTPNKFDTWVHSMTSELADKFYASYGPEANRSIFQKAVSIVPISVLHHVTDPVRWMRSVTFNFKLGLFAIPQFIVQAQTHALIWALEPRHGTSGTYAMLLHNWSKFTDNPAILDSLDQYATKLNGFGSKWKPGEFLEARRELDKAGFEHVAGEYSNLNTQLKTKFIQNDFDKFLHAGQAPFRLGEQTTRQTAWYTAFREFREANPNTPITNIERTKILNKADLLTVNMSRASSSMINEGVFSLSTQFLTYQIKLAELFLGKRLGETTGERMLARGRILAMFTALYGLPNAVGVTGAPFSDGIRSSLMDDLGYIPGEKWYSTMVNEGIPAWTLSQMTGKIDNVGDRFGSQGFENIKNMLRGDASWWNVVGGASSSVVGKTFSTALDPFSQYVQSWIRGDKEGFTIRAADLAEPLKQISSISTGSKWWTAIQTGKWLNTNEGYVSDVTPVHASLLALTGMSPQEQDDMFIQNEMVKGEKDAKKAALREFIKDWRRGIEAKSNGDTEQGNAYFRNAIARSKVVGMSPQELNTAIAIGNRGYERMIDSSDVNVWKEGDQNKLDQRMQQYKRKLKMNDEGTR
jgi:hypothetical protein